MILHKPLDYIKVTQPFGVNWLRPDNYFQYADYGLKGHNGIDFSTNNQSVYAVADGIVHDKTDKGYGIGLSLWVDLESGDKLEVRYGHLRELISTGKVKRGSKIAISNNTGLSTGPHLHLGTRVWKEGNVVNYKNGYYGYFDPSPLFPSDMFKLPVELKYGEKEMHMPLLQWYKANAYFWKVTGHLMTRNEKYAFIYGYWGMREVLDPAMYQTWTTMTKPEFLKRIGKL